MDAVTILIIGVLFPVLRPNVLLRVLAFHLFWGPMRLVMLGPQNNYDFGDPSKIIMITILQVFMQSRSKQRNTRVEEVSTTDSTA